MLATMMDYPLALTPLLERARRLFPDKEIVTKQGASMQRRTYSQVIERVGRLANALEKLGVQQGDRVATLAWNSGDHLELYLGVPCMGAVLHPLNLRLAVEQLAFIMQHAEDRYLCVDATLLPLAERLAPLLKGVRAYIILGSQVPENCTLKPAFAYEELLAAAAPDYAWPHLDENRAAAMCYTSGTTGKPRGVVYSHRSIMLHSLSLSLPDAFCISESDRFMPVVPMFHVMAWGFPYACTLLGAAQVMPGPHLNPRDLAGLIQDEKVSLTAGVPTLWIGLLHLLENERYDLNSLRGMIVGGAAAPQWLIEAFQKRHGLTMLHAWGMTETSPYGASSRLHSHQLDLPEAERMTYLARQGTPPPGIEIRAMQENGQEAPWDGETFGELQVRGPWVIGSYYNDPDNEAAFQDGWFRTGDVVTIDPRGSILIVDRLRDLVKSGGEWISSVALENALMGHPKVLEAAVIAIPHPRWQERPLACVALKPEARETGMQPSIKEELLAHLASQFPRWNLPDDIVFMDSLPKTGVGKFDKKALRKSFAQGKLEIQ